MGINDQCILQNAVESTASISKSWWISVRSDCNREQWRVHGKRAMGAISP